jgi:hypothetical protein
MAAFALTMTFATRTEALPAFAAQTGQPCQMCHVGGFGPQLTPFGRNFKLGGYTQRSTPFSLPVSAMVVASYLRTQQSPPEPPAPGYSHNDNVTLDQASLFLAGGLGSHFGGFAQLTYDGVGKAWAWDNLDLRLVGSRQIGGATVVFGASLNNNPTIVDAWNTLPGWGFPYTDSALAPSPAAAPLLAGALAQETIGLTAYAWINSELYLEGGAYATPSASALHHLGADPFSPGAFDGAAPYGRIAVQKTFGAKTVEIGVFGMRASIFPGRDRSAGASDIYRDIGVDASFYTTLASGDVVTVNARYLSERETLNASQPLGLAANLHDEIRDVRADISYYWRNKVGGTVQVFDTTGSADSLLYGANSTFKPDSSGVTLQVDGTPFGDRDQPRRRVNVRIGAQYTIYAKFNGAHANFDGAGTRASDENTFRIFTWFAF